MSKSFRICLGLFSTFLLLAYSLPYCSLASDKSPAMVHKERADSTHTPTPDEDKLFADLSKLAEGKDTSKLATIPSPTSTLACVILLAPVKGADLPLTGKVTFSWTPMNEAESYVLNIILPSGETISFETDQTFRDRYMEAFVAGGEYQWQVIAQDKNGSEVCVSEVSTFDKPAYEKPKDNNGNDGNNTGDGGGEEGPPGYND